MYGNNYKIAQLHDYLISPQLFSSCAYFSTSFFNPKRGNCTVILASSPSPSRRYTVPSPYFGCRTFCPGRNPRRPFGVSTGTLGTLNFFPRDAKKLAILSIELYFSPVEAAARAGLSAH